MSPATIALALLLGFAAGVLAGLFGVGGGILFVPTLVGLGLGQVEASATSLLAIVPTAAMAIAREHRAGTLDVRSSLFVGAASVAGVTAGVQIAQNIPEDLLRRLFGALLLLVAAQLAWRGRRRPTLP
ncbi:MAG: sulfite exporter TauE/SafE family protein [Gaiella sp.]